MRKIPQKALCGALLAASLVAARASSQMLEGVDIRALSNRAFVEVVKEQTSTMNGVIDANTKLTFRKLRLLRIPNGRRVCGEIQDDVDQTWIRFFTDLNARGAEIEPYATHDLAILDPFEKQCSTALKTLPVGGKGSAEDVRACAAAGLTSEAKFQKARFELLYALSCNEAIWPSILE